MLQRRYKSHARGAHRADHTRWPVVTRVPIRIVERAAHLIAAGTNVAQPKYLEKRWGPFHVGAGIRHVLAPREVFTPWNGIHDCHRAGPTGIRKKILPRVWGESWQMLATASWVATANSCAGNVKARFGSRPPGDRNTRSLSTPSVLDLSEPSLSLDQPESVTYQRLPSDLIRGGPQRREWLRYEIRIGK